MTRWIRIWRKISRKRLNLYLTHLLLFVMPFSPRLVPAAIGLFLVSNLTVHSWKERVAFFQSRKKFILLFTLPYILHIVGLAYTDNMEAGLFSLEVKFSLFVFPLVVLTSNVINKYTLPELLKTFVFGVTIASLISFLYAGISYFKTEDAQVFYYTYLSYYQHVGYFAMYINFAISIVFVFIFHHKNRVKMHYYVALTILIVTVYQLSSRAGMIVLIMLILYGFAYLIFPKLKWKNPLIALSIVMLVTAGVVSFSITKLNRFSQASEEIAEGDRNSSAGSRVAMWKESLSLMAESPIWGYGTGDANDVLQERFKEKRFAYAVVHNLNVHNQYIQVTLALGLLGLLALLLQMFYPLIYIIRQTNFLYVLFIANVGLNFLTESMLEAQAGTVFFGLFSAFLFFTWHK